jgi:hypothetical protein
MWTIVRKRISVLDEPITNVLSRMNKCDMDSKEYGTLIEHLDRLNTMKAEERKTRVSRDTVWIVAGNLAGILAIVIYEQRHPMTSRAMNFVLQAKTAAIRTQ